MSQLTHKVALITGGNSGMGLETAKLFKAQGAQVIITARSAETYQKAQAEFGTQFDVVQTDVSKVGDLDRLYAHIKGKYGKLDILFANAGIAKFSPSTETSEALFDDLFNTNVRGLYFTVTRALPLLAKGSSVILNSSTVSEKGIAGSSAYSATKAAVRSLARTWTAEIPLNLARFNVISPGPIETPIFEKMGVDEATKSHLAQSTPAKRFGTSQEIAQVALFLASDASTYMAGADVKVDGGFSAV